MEKAWPIQEINNLVKINITFFMVKHCRTPSASSSASAAPLSASQAERGPRLNEQGSLTRRMSVQYIRLLGPALFEIAIGIGIEIGFLNSIGRAVFLDA